MIRLTIAISTSDAARLISLAQERDEDAGWDGGELDHGRALDDEYLLSDALRDILTDALRGVPSGEDERHRAENLDYWQDMDEEKRAGH